MNSEPLISIVTVCLNAVGHIEKCINSVINQTYTNIEYIVIDGGSTDGTLDIIKKYEDRITHWISERDRGIYDAMNKGISMCKGVFVGLLSSDDYYAGDAVQKIVETINSDNSVDVIHGNHISTCTSSNFNAKYVDGDLLKHMTMSHPTCFIRADVYKIYKYDISYKIAADYDLLIKLMKVGKKFKDIDHVITYVSPYGVSSQPSMSTVIEKFNIRLKYSLAIAVQSMFKDILFHCEGVYYNYASTNKLLFARQGYISVILKKIFRPLLFFIKRRLY